jgi:hypothetical protein
MSTTRTLQRRRPAAHAPAHTPAHAPTSAPLAPISPADVEAALLDNYPDLVRLAYANLPAKLPRHRRVLAAHTVVQHALQGHDLLGVTDAKAFVRDRVQADSIKQAQARTPIRRKPQAWGLALLALTEPTGDAAFDPCSLKPACSAELLRRNARAANLVIVVTTLLALGILASLLIHR